MKEQCCIVLDLERKWFETVPWASVVTANQGLCLKDGQPHGLRPGAGETARQVWEEEAARRCPLCEALALCRRIHQLEPFLFFNGNTMAAVTAQLVEPVLRPLPSVQAQIIRSTVAHYVVGAIKLSELKEVCRHFAHFWAAPAATRAPAPDPALETRPSWRTS